MTNLMRIALLLAAALALAIAPSAKADSTMFLTGAGNNTMDNVYIGPYTATINGVSTPVICDDFAHDSFIGDLWTASVTPLTDVVTSSNVRWASQADKYDQAAWLTLQLISAPADSQAAAIQYAIWDLFDPGDVSRYLAGFSNGATFLNNSSDAAGAQYWLDAAANVSPSGWDVSNFMIYTPAKCIGGPCLSGSEPQEFIVRTPEPNTIPLLLAGLGPLIWLARRGRLANPV